MIIGNKEIKDINLDNFFISIFIYLFLIVIFDDFGGFILFFVFNIKDNFVFVNYFNV